MNQCCIYKNLSKCEVGQFIRLEKKMKESVSTAHYLIEI